MPKGKGLRRKEGHPLPVEPLRLLRQGFRRLLDLSLVSLVQNRAQDFLYADRHLLLGLRWDDVDLERGTLRVGRSLVREGGRHTVGETKTRRGRRQVNLTPRTVNALKAHRKRQLEEKIRLVETYKDHGLIFSTRVGTPVNPENLVKRSFKPLLEKAALPKICCHDLRRTCATLLLGRGVHPMLVQELLGHATVAMTLDTYSHYLPSIGDQASGTMGDALG